MQGINAAYKDLEREYEKEISKPTIKRKGTTILMAPEKNMKVKFEYCGLCAKKDGKVVQMYHDFQALGKLEGKVRKILLKPLNKRKLGEFEYYKISEL